MEPTPKWRQELEGELTLTFVAKSGKIEKRVCVSCAEFRRMKRLLEESGRLVVEDKE